MADEKTIPDVIDSLTAVTTLNDSDTFILTRAGLPYKVTKEDLTAVVGSSIGITDAGGFYVATDVEEALQEIGAGIENSASNITVDDAGGFYTGQTVEAILQEHEPSQNSKSTGGGQDQYFTLAGVSGATNLDWSLGNYADITSTAGNYTLSNTGLVAGKLTAVTIEIDTTTTGHTPTFWTGITYPNGTPAITWTGGTKQLLFFTSKDGFTTSLGYHLTPSAPIEMVSFGQAGIIVAGTVGTMRLYNDMGETVTVVSVRFSLGNSPATTSSIADANINGTTMFTTKPTVVAGGNTGKVTTVNNPLWDDGEYITVDFDTAGDAGSAGDATVTVAFRRGA